MMECGVKTRVRKQAESGFSLIEVMISMVILTVGLVAMLSVFALAMSSTQTSQQDMIAKQLANEAYESIVTARNTSQISWININNVGSLDCPGAASPCGIFVGTPLVAAFMPLYNAGADGIFGTADDAVAGEQTLREPGPGGNYGDADDVILPLTAYQRAIQISPLFNADGTLVSTLRSVTITIQYTTPQAKLPKTYVLNSFISQYR